MKRSEYIKQMEARSLIMKDIDLNKVAVESINTRIDAVDISDTEYNKAITKKRFLEENNAELAHKKRMIEVQVDAQTRSSLEPDNQADLFEESDDAADARQDS